ncbi:hypothetical protein Efla_004889 [Eimeria flavescens]
MPQTAHNSGDIEMAGPSEEGREFEESDAQRRDSKGSRRGGPSSRGPSSRGPSHASQSALSVRTSRSKYDKYSRANEDEDPERAVSGFSTGTAGPFKKMKASTAAFFSDMFGTELDFAAAFRKAKGERDGMGRAVTSRTEQQEHTVRAWEHLKFFPLTFKESNFETQYGLICSQLFIGRLFVVLLALTFLVIPVLWLLGSLCLLDVDLNKTSEPAWIAFHIAFATNLVIALCSLILTAFPKIMPCLRKYFELYAYWNVFAWLSMLLIVLATFPTLVKAPPQMEQLWTVDAHEIEAFLHAGHPSCGSLQTVPGLQSFLSCLQSGQQTTACVQQCSTDPACLAAVFGLVGSDIQLCQDMQAALADNCATLGKELAHLWYPFAFYLPFVKATLQVFKVPIVAVALIICVFGTGLMFLDTMSPSRTKMTLALHLLVVPLCSLPFILLHRNYPSIAPLEETLLFVCSFLFVAAAGWFGRYAQEFQHRLMFCSWRITTNMLQELHKKMEKQKESKKASTAIEELIFQVKECNNIIRMARLRGPRADVTDDLFHAEQLLEKILEMLTASGNLYSVRFTDAAKENDVQRQFIELYNEPEKMRKDDLALNKGERMATAGSRSVIRQATAGSRMHEAARTTAHSGFGSGLSSSGPVTGFEFSTDTLKRSFASGQVEEMYALWKNLPMPEATHQLLASVGVDWDFDILAFSNTTENVLLEVGYALLCRLVGDWGCEETQLIRFLATIQGQYLPNPYHNKVHGATVAHLTECLTRMLNAQRVMNSVEKATLTVAAICHDVGHPGRNNQFFVNCYDPLAVIYNDQAVLENFHSCLTFRTLELKECNVFVNLEDFEFRYIRQNLIACILATDMKQHFESISRFRIRRNSPEFSYQKKQEDLWLVARMCVKVADIGHSSVPWAQHFQWSCRVTEEFYQQGEEELSRGMTVSPLCDPEKHADMAKSQNGFLEFVVKPLLKEIEEVEPFAQIKNTVSMHLANNMSKWQLLQEGGQPIVLKAYDQPGKVTATAGAVRKIAGIKRGPPHRTAEPGTTDTTPIVSMPTRVRSDLEKAKQDNQQTPEAAADEPPVPISARASSASSSSSSAFPSSSASAFDRAPSAKGVEDNAAKASSTDGPSSKESLAKVKEEPEEEAKTLELGSPGGKCVLERKQKLD